MTKQEESKISVEEWKKLILEFMMSYPKGSTFTKQEILEGAHKLARERGLK